MPIQCELSSLGVGGGDGELVVGEIQRSSAALIVPNVRGRFLEMGKGRIQILERDPERVREELRGILGDRIKLQPDKSGRFLWAQYSLGLSALLPKQEHADIVVAGACLRLIARS